MSRQQEQDPFLLTVQVDNTVDLINILSGLQITTSEDKKDKKPNRSQLWTHVELTDAGLRFTLEDPSKCFQAISNVKKELFSDYNFRTDTLISFQINLCFLIDCLRLYGTATLASQLSIMYPGLEKTLKIQLRDPNGVLTDCAIKTRDSDDTLTRFRFRDSRIPNKVVIKSDVLKEMLAEAVLFEEPIAIRIAPTEPYFQIYVEGNEGELALVLPKTSDAFYGFESEYDQSFRYKFNHIRHCLHAISMEACERTAIMMNEHGTILLRNELKTQPSVTHVEYYFVPENVGNDIGITDEFDNQEDLTLE
jgi:hypothetical protein